MPPSSPAPQDVGRLLISCPDRPGIVAAVSGFLYGQGANIVDASQHSTAGPGAAGGTFFMRVEFELPGLMSRGPSLEAAFAPLAAQFGISRRTIHYWMGSGQLTRDLEAEEVRYKARPPKPCKLDPFKPLIHARLEAFPALTGVRLF